jgi:hypothetical protein
MSSRLTLALSILFAVAVLFLAWYLHEPTGEELAQEFTEQTARAILLATDKISGAIIVASMILGIIRK